MNRHSDIAEVVWVKNASRLVDAESYERAYAIGGGRPLRCGYYVARWPAGTQNPGFLTDEPKFQGPYPTRREAQAEL